MGQSDTHDYQTDQALKRLFSNPEMIEQLLRWFVPKEWLFKFDFSSLRKLNTHHISENLHKRDSDIIWIIDVAKEPVCIIFLLEFQSSSDHFMALRFLVYAGLIYQDLIKQHRWKANQFLPPILPMVLYTGKLPWKAPLIFQDCLNKMTPKFLSRYQPNIAYVVLDINRVSEAEISLNDSLLALFVGIEQASTQEKLITLLAKLGIALKGEQFNRVRRDFVLYFSRASRMRNRFPQIDLDTLGGLNTMLRERFIEWENEAKQKGWEEGKYQGMQQGMQQTERSERLFFLNALLSRNKSKMTAQMQRRIELADNMQLKRWIEMALQGELSDELV